jgi:hypothetical protein
MGLSSQKFMSQDIQDWTFICYRCLCVCGCDLLWRHYNMYIYIYVYDHVKFWIDLFSRNLLIHFNWSFQVYCNPSIRKPNAVSGRLWHNTVSSTRHWGMMNFRDFNQDWRVESLRYPQPIFWVWTKIHGLKGKSWPEIIDFPIKYGVFLQFFP